MSSNDDENVIVPADDGDDQSDYTADNESTPLLQASSSSRGRKMPEKNIGISQQTLVSSPGDRSANEGAKLPQYIAAISATLGALAMGMVLAWTAAVKDEKELSRQYKISVDAEQYSWIGSFVNLGAAAICVPIGVISDKIGRKTAMLGLAVPFTIGWLVISFANSVLMFYLGRFIVGLSGGAFCVAAPMYTSEIAESSIRGTLGSYFQLMLTVGILFTYLLATVLDIYQLSLLSTVVPVVFAGVFFFMPESPIYYLKKGDEDSARAALVRLRGPNYNVESEIQAQLAVMAETERNKESFSTAIRSRAAIRGLIIGFGLMFIQQLSGVNAIIFYASKIFASASEDISASTSTIIVGVIQVVAVFISTLIVDRAGRRILLLSSIVSMFVTTLIIGIYFFLKHQNAEQVKSIGWLPLLCICLFIFMFSIGFGPIPWMMMSEIFSSTIKGIAGSSACLFNWFMAFIVTKYYSPLEEAAGNYTCFWIFSGICLGGIVFVLFLVPETKGKTLEQIQFELGGNKPSSNIINSSIAGNSYDVKV